MAKTTKILESGIEVEADEYYKLLEWRDNNRDKFRAFLEEYGLTNESINLYNKQQYSWLLMFSLTHYD